MISLLDQLAIVFHMLCVRETKTKKNRWGKKKKKLIHPNQLLGISSMMMMMMLFYEFFFWTNKFEWKMNEKKGFVLLKFCWSPKKINKNPTKTKHLYFIVVVVVPFDPIRVIEIISFINKKKLIYLKSYHFIRYEWNIIQILEQCLFVYVYVSVPKYPPPKKTYIHNGHNICNFCLLSKTIISSFLSLCVKVV